MPSTGLHSLLRSLRPYAFTVLLISLVGGAVTFQLLRNEKRRQLQETVGEVGGVFAGQVRADLDNLIRNVTEIGERRFKQLQPDVKERGLEVDRDFLDVSLWARSEGTIKPRRVYQHFNSRYINPSQEIVLRSEAIENIESGLIAPAFRGQVVVGLAMGLDPGTVALMAIPFGQGAANTEVIVVHLALSRFQRIFRWDSPMRAVLVTMDGMMLAHSGYKVSDNRENFSAHPLVRAMQTDTLNRKADQVDFDDSHGFRHIGSYVRVNLGDLAVITSIPEVEAGLEFGQFFEHGVRLMAILFALATLGGLAMGGNFRFRMKLPSIRLDSEEGSTTAGPDSQAQEPSIILSTAGRKLSPESRGVTVLHCSLTQVSQLSEAFGPEIALSALNEYLTQASVRVRYFEGRFEKGEGASFIAVWDGADAHKRAIRCALELRRDFTQFNAVRRLDGEKPLSLGMGIDTGVALAGNVGPATEGKFSIIGDVLACSRKLDQMSESVGTDLLVSEEVWLPVQDKFLGTKTGEWKLTAASGLKTYYSIQGFRDEAGGEVNIPSGNPPSTTVTGVAGTNSNLAIPRPEHSRWLVSNGSQILGPWSATEIAQRLFSQELDFDCECWVEGTGKPAQLSTCGIFAGSGDEGAEYWVYDDVTIHGPLSAGFLRTALTRRAISKEAKICHKTTVNGWRLVSAWWEEEKRSFSNAAAEPAAAKPVASTYSQPVRELPAPVVQEAPAAGPADPLPVPAAETAPVVATVEVTGVEPSQAESAPEAVLAESTEPAPPPPPVGESEINPLVELTLGDESGDGEDPERPGSSGSQAA